MHSAWVLFGLTSHLKQNKMKSVQRAKPLHTFFMNAFCFVGRFCLRFPHKRKAFCCTNHSYSFLRKQVGCLRGQILHLCRFVCKLKRKVFLVECEGLSAKIEFFVGTTGKFDLLALGSCQTSGFYLDFLCFCLAFHRFISFFRIYVVKNYRFSLLGSVSLTGSGKLSANAVASLSHRSL